MAEPPLASMSSTAATKGALQQVELLDLQDVHHRIVEEYQADGVLRRYELTAGDQGFLDTVDPTPLHGSANIAQKHGDDGVADVLLLLPEFLGLD